MDISELESIHLLLLTPVYLLLGWLVTSMRELRQQINHLDREVHRLMGKVNNGVTQWRTNSHPKTR